MNTISSVDVMRDGGSIVVIVAENVEPVMRLWLNIDPFADDISRFIALYVDGAFHSSNPTADTPADLIERKKWLEHVKEIRSTCPEGRQARLLQRFLDGLESLCAD